MTFSANDAGNQSVAITHLEIITMKRRFTASVWREDDWYVAQCLEVDVASQGKSEQEALDNLREALELYFEPPTPTITPQIHSIEAEIGIA